MNKINSIDDFIRLIDDSSYNGYKVCLSKTSFHKDWTAEHHILHLINVREHSSETGILFEIVTHDFNGRLCEVEVHVHSSANCPIEVNESTVWVIRYCEQDH